MNDHDMLRTLVNAEVCCAICGQDHGQIRDSDALWWEGQCHVCGAVGPITDTQSFGYMRSGVESIINRRMNHG
jgi:hypothetical protein